MLAFKPSEVKHELLLHLPAFPANGLWWLLREESFYGKERAAKVHFVSGSYVQEGSFNSWRGKDYFSEFPAVLRSSA